MAITSTLDGDLAERLQSQANVRHLSVEGLPRRTLGDAMAHVDNAAWERWNQRRVGLI